MNPVRNIASIILTAGLVVWIESFVTIEWSYPYCISPEDGPAYGAYGMPLPYWMWNGVASLEHDFVPHVYILNIVLLSLLLFPVIRWILDRVISKSKWLRTAIGAIGALLLLSHVALTILMISDGYLRPTTTLGLGGDGRHYSEFRPVRIGLHRGNAPVCTPSPFWFPNGWQHK